MTKMAQSENHVQETESVQL